MKILSLALVSCVFLISCAKSKAPLMQAPPEKFEKIEIAAGETKKIQTPKVNVLFVVDNSGSMKDHQETLRKNIGTFADAFINTPRIDYKIGVVPVYDSRYLNDDHIYPTAGRRQMNPLGELVALKNADGSLVGSVPYVTRNTPNAKEVLKSTVALGVQWGPEAEESFSPVLEIIQNEALNETKNEGFYDKDAYLVVIFLTDADDVTKGVTSSQFYKSLVAAKGGNREKVLIAAALANPVKRSATCKVDGSGPAYKFPDLLSVSKAFYADLCSGNFGKAFAEFGQSIADKIATQRIRINFLPDVNFELSYGTPDMAETDRQVVPLDGPGAAVFLPDTNDFILPSDLAITPLEGGEIYIKATPIQIRNAGTGRLKTL